jgi:hypothetical protein
VTTSSANVTERYDDDDDDDGDGDGDGDDDAEESTEEEYAIEKPSLHGSTS